VKPAEVCFYFDADILGLGKLLAGLRSDCTYPGDPGAIVHKRARPPCIVTKASTLDVDWLPVVAAQGWLVITRDRHIRNRPKELAMVRDHGAKLVALASRDALSTFSQLEVVMTRWRDLDRLVATSGPFVLSASRTALTPIPL